MLTRQDLANQAASLAVQGVYIGTSSLKYPGWCGMLYDRAGYEYRGKFAETRFKQDLRDHFTPPLSLWRLLPPQAWVAANSPAAGIRTG